MWKLIWKWICRSQVTEKEKQSSWSESVERSGKNANKAKENRIKGTGALKLRVDREKAAEQKWPVEKKIPKFLPEKSPNSQNQK